MLRFKLIGKQHYKVCSGAVIEFDVFDEDGNTLRTEQVVLNEAATVYIENNEVDVQFKIYEEK